MRLSFDGETGPYCQYAVVRARNIFRKAAEQEASFRIEQLAGVEDSAVAALLQEPGGDDLWEVILLASVLDYEVRAAVSAQEPALVAKHAFELSQAFNLFYHRHRILSEVDAARKRLLLQISLLVERQLVSTLGLLGIEAPEKM